MVSLRRDSNGNFIARKRLPDDVREDYGQLYGARFEAKFFARASVGKQIAQQKFRQWATEVEQRIEAIRKARRGEGLDLNRSKRLRWRATGTSGSSPSTRMKKSTQSDMKTRCGTSSTRC